MAFISKDLQTKIDEIKENRKLVLPLDKNTKAYSNGVTYSEVIRELAMEMMEENSDYSRTDFSDKELQKALENTLTVLDSTGIFMLPNSETVSGVPTYKIVKALAELNNSNQDSFLFNSKITYWGVTSQSEMNKRYEKYKNTIDKMFLENSESNKYINEIISRSNNPSSSKTKNKIVANKKISLSNGNVFNNNQKVNPGNNLFNPIPEINTFERERGLDNSTKLDLTAIETDHINKFQSSKYGYQENIDVLEPGICYAFMTKPSLNLSTLLGDSYNLSASERKSNTKLSTNKTLNNTLENGFVEWVARNHPEIIKSLITADTIQSQSPIPNCIPLLFNHFLGISNIEDLVLDEGQYSETLKGYTQRLPNNATKSYSSGNLQINYWESDPPLLIYLHKIWVEYIDKVKFGQYEPTTNSINRRELDYSSSLYYFVCRPDGQTITFYGRFTGLFPMSVPYSGFGGDIASNQLNPSISASYMFNHKSFLEPEILVDFNDTMYNNGNLQLSNYKGDIIDINEIDTYKDNVIKMIDSNPTQLANENIKNSLTMIDAMQNSTMVKRHINSKYDKTSFSKALIVKDKGKYKLLFVE